MALKFGINGLTYFFSKGGSVLSVFNGLSCVTWHDSPVPDEERFGELFSNS